MQISFLVISVKQRILSISERRKKSYVIPDTLIQLCLNNLFKLIHLCCSNVRLSDAHLVCFLENRKEKWIHNELEFSLPLGKTRQESRSTRDFFSGLDKTGTTRVKRMFGTAHVVGDATDNGVGLTTFVQIYAFRF